jgi:hypothetical protein
MTNTESFCFYCGKPGEAMCESPECKAYDRELCEEIDRQHKEDLRAAFWAALRDRCKIERDHELNRFSRWFYTAKCLICLLLGWSRNYEVVEGYPKVIDVGQYHYAKLYAGWEQSWIAVGRGVFTQWWYELEEDGEWLM